MPFLPKVKLHIIDSLHNNGWLFNSVFNKLTCLVARLRTTHNFLMLAETKLAGRSIQLSVIRSFVLSPMFLWLPYHTGSNTLCTHVVERSECCPTAAVRLWSINYEVWQSNEINFLLAILPVLQRANTYSIWPSSVPTCSGTASQCLGVEWVRDVSHVCKPCRGNGSTEYRAAECHLFCVKLGENATTHGKLKQAFAMSKSTSLSLAQHVFWKQNRCWRWVAQRATINNTDRWQRSRGERTRSIRTKISQNDCWWSEHVPGNRSFDKDWRIEDDKNACQDGAQESDRVTARCAVERLCWSAGTRPTAYGPSYHWWRELVFTLIRRPNVWVWNGVQRDHQGQRKQVKSKRHAFVFDPMGIVHKEWVPAEQIISLHRNSWKPKKQGHGGSYKHCEKLDPSSRQCASPCSAPCSAVLDIQMHCGDAANPPQHTMCWTVSTTLILNSLIPRIAVGPPEPDT